MQNFATYETEELKEVRSGLQLLASQNQDGARQENGVGFNKMHSGIGEYLAMNSPWEQRDIEQACRIAQTYINTQLAHLSTSTKVFIRTTVKESNERRIDKVNKNAQQDKKIDWSDLTKRFIITFPFPNPEVLQATRALSQRAFDASTKNWTAPASISDEIKQYAETYEFTLTQAALATINAPKAIEYGVEMYGATFGVRASAALKEELKARLLGREWRSELVRWVVPFSEWASVKSFAEDYNLTVNPSIDWDAIAKVANEGIEMATSLSADPLEAPEGVKMLGNLHPFQWAGLRYILEKKRVLQADSPGLGKSAQSIYGVAYAQKWPVLVVCPAVLKTNWTRELTKWTVGRSSYIISGRRGFIPSGYDMYVINYDILSDRVEQLASFGFHSLVLDESVAIKSNKAQRTKAAKKIAASIPEDGLILALNGTPVTSAPYDIVAQLGALGVLKLFGGSGQFLREYCGGTSGGSSSPRMLQKLNRELLKHCMVRRTKEQVLTDLPDAVHSVTEVPFTHKTEYEKAEADLINFIRERAFNVAKAVAGLDDKEAMAEAKAAAVRAQQAEVLVRISTLRQISARGKYESAKQFIQNFIEQGEKVLVFAHHRAITQELAKELGAPAIIGGLSDTVRQDAVDKFQNDPNCKAIVLSIDAAGVGLTLTAGSTCVFIETAWTPARMEQAWSRAHRIGQKDTVNTYTLIPDFPESIDEYMQDILSRKKAIVDAIIDGRIVEEDDTSAISELIDIYSQR